MRDQIYYLVSGLLRPYWLLVLLVTVSSVLLMRNRTKAKWRFRVLAASLLGLWLVSMPAVSYLALGTLEWRYPPSRERPEDVQAIVVLSGYLSPSNTFRPWDELGAESMYRCVLGAELYREGDPCLIFVTGGSVRRPDVTPLADVMAAFLVDLGVDRENIVIENESRSTYENARNVARPLQSRGIRRAVLVTDATHLLRSEMCFRKQGIEVVPRGVYYRATQFRGSVSNFLPSADAVQAIDVVLHEWLGIVWYWVRGRI